MNTFTESTTVEQMILDAVTRLGGAGPSALREDALGCRASLGGEEFRLSRWDYVPVESLRHLGCPRGVDGSHSGGV